MDEVFSHVISSTGLANVEAAESAPVWQSECPRESIGYSCVRDTTFACLCKFVESASISIERTRVGEPLLLTLELTVSNEAASDGAAAVLTGMKMTGLRSAMNVKNRLITATFDLNRYENKVLKAFVSETS